jgi:hypothetical protein
MYGFENMTKSLGRAHRIEDSHAITLTLDALICLAEAIGARRVENPEEYNWWPRRTSTDEVIAEIEKVLDFPISVPNPYPSEYGLFSKRGVMSYRVPQAIYQAWRISQLVSGISNPKILEIGGGLGRTAYYTSKFGITDYTIVDIPISSLAQGYFLGTVLGAEAVLLYGEANLADSEAEKTKVVSPSSFFEGSGHYDLIVNVDSLTEIGEEVAKEYWLAIQKRADVFLSINHEENGFTVSQFIEERTGVAKSIRYPYWLRRGYTEEVVVIK